MRTKLLAVVATACLLVGGLTVANAAQLSVTSGSISTASATRCAAAIASDATDPELGWGFWLVGYHSVTLAGAPAECAGKPVQVIVYRTSNGGELTRSAVLTLSAGTFEIPVNQAFGGWLAPSWGLGMIIDGWVVTAS